MRKITLVALALITLAASCKKEETTTPTPSTPTTPTTTGPTAAMPTPSGGDISGALISVRMVYSSTPVGSPIAVDLTSEIGTAVFYSSPGSTTYVDAGTVSVNSVNLDKATNSTYSKMATTGLTPSTLNFDGGSNWSVGGSGSVTAFNYNHTSAFPSYTGSVPTTVTKSSGVTLSFNSSNLTGADSVIVLIASGSTSVTKTYAATAGSVTISASDLSGLTAVSNNSGIFEVCPYKYVFYTTGGKKYVAIKEQAVVKNVNIN